MANTRSFSSVAASPGPAPAAAPARHRLRAVDRDEEWPLPQASGAGLLGQDVTALLPPGTTWLPAPPNALPTLPGRPPMIGYLILVPADQQTRLASAVPDAAPERPDPADEPLVRVDSVRRTAEIGGRPLDLTYLEFELLAHLVAHPHQVHTRDQLVTTVWGYGHVGDGRTVDVHIARLRRKLGAEHRDAILTVRRVGYKYAPPTAG
ncbi:winged helix-turn-helix domain-containing protein [Streptomyces fructofermentans]|uniref:Transcriptional regulator n=1 Tax=Streptomyces fructofermentans TaxID=152141 RepID=A0A918KMC8_9ACTN|nr:winged helix-turn-helix domain-containing protein [Streptomyces fructofermentans]GGX66368.1 transcriptional regulator [Streptomyces fructofermentans]